MRTINEAIEAHIEGNKAGIQRLRKLQARLEETNPAFLHHPIEGCFLVDNARVSMFDRGNHIVAREVTLAFMGLAGIGHVRKHLAYNKQDWIADIPIDDIMCRVWWESYSPGCKRYRVTQEIEVCGELDKSEYISIEEIVE